MKLCARCGNYKPNACFAKDTAKVTPGNPLEHSRCLHCRTIGAEVRDKNTKPPHQAPRIAPTLHDTLLMSIAREEFNAFLRRGAPEMPRPYVHDGTGALVGKRVRRQRLRLTSSMLGI